VINHLQEILTIPDKIEQILARNEEIETIAKELFRLRISLPWQGNPLSIALEGALKLKEITYIHAEGYLQVR